MAPASSGKTRARVTKKIGDKAGEQQAEKGRNGKAEQAENQGGKTAEEDKGVSFKGQGKFSFLHGNSGEEGCRPRPCGQWRGGYFFEARTMAILPVRTISLIPSGRRMSITALILDSEPVISRA